jgi:hypothetical protein
MMNSETKTFMKEQVSLQKSMLLYLKNIDDQLTGINSCLRLLLNESDNTSTPTVPNTKSSPST